MIQHEQKAIRKLLPTHIVNNDGESIETVLILNESVDHFKTEITCPICLGPLDKSWAVMACLHRFCEDCFHRSLRMELGSNSQKECPLCRVKLASRRSSRPDKDFDSFLEVISFESINTVIPNSSYFALTSNFYNDGQYELWQQQTPNEYATDWISTTTNNNDDNNTNNNMNNHDEYHHQQQQSQQQQQQQSQSQSPRQQQSRSPRQQYSNAINRASDFDLSEYRRAHESNILSFRKRQADWRTEQHRENNNNRSNKRNNNNNSSGNSNNSVAFAMSNNYANISSNTNSNRHFIVSNDMSPSASNNSFPNNNNKNNSSNSISNNNNIASSNNNGALDTTYSVHFSLSPTQESMNKISPLKKPYLIVPPDFTIADIKIYLLDKQVTVTAHSNSNSSNNCSGLSIFVVMKTEAATASDGDDDVKLKMMTMMELKDTITMKEVCSSFWDHQSKLELFYNIL